MIPSLRTGPRAPEETSATFDLWPLMITWAISFFTLGTLFGIELAVKL